MGLGKKYRKKEYGFWSPKIQKEIKLLLLADLHGKSYGKQDCELVEDLAKEKPDAIMVAGDMVLAKKDRAGKSIAKALELFEKLQGICPVFYGNGNHETKIKEKKDIFGTQGKDYEKALQKIGVTLLSNESVKVCIEGNHIVISGLETERSYFKKWGKLSMETSYLEGNLGQGNLEEYHILLAHNPHYFSTYRDWGADLTLSGHLHGGVVGFPGRGGVISPQFKLFPKYTAGLFEERGKKLVVSRGLGEHLVNLRIFNPREYVVLNISPEKEVRTSGKKG